MSENENMELETEQTGQETGGAGADPEPTPVTSSSVINQVVEAVITMMNTRTYFASVSRGALPTGVGLVCEVGPSIFSSMHMDKALVYPLDLTLNGKHGDLRTLSDAMNGIHSHLTFSREYPADSSGMWQIIDILNGTAPQIIGREENNEWLMASSLTVKFYWKGEMTGNAESQS